MLASVQGLSFVASRATGNPLHQIIHITDTSDKKWTVRNETQTPWIRVTPNGNFGDGFFDVSVNIFEPSVIIGGQSGLLFVESPDPTIQISIMLNVTP
jgi:hypothetical protein